MQQLEAAAKVLSEEARRDPARMPGKDILFVRYCWKATARETRIFLPFLCACASVQISHFRGGTTEDEQSLAERSRTTNPDEINIDDDEGSDEDEQVEGKKWLRKAIAASQEHFDHELLDCLSIRTSH